MAKGIHDIRKKITQVYEMVLCATHEAGHAIFGLLHHMKVESVCIFENKKTKRVEGLTYFDLGISLEHIYDSKLFNQRLHDEICMRYAGLTAEKHHFKITSGSDRFPIFLRDGSSDDTMNAAKLIRQYNMTDPGRKRYLYKKKAIKETLLELQNNWEAVTLVAHALFKRKKLTYIELQELLTKKTNNKAFWREKFKEINNIYHNFDEEKLKTTIIS
jgi:hypothetical protein